MENKTIELTIVVAILSSFLSMMIRSALKSNTPENQRFLAEIRRKTFHFIGLSVPASYYYLLSREILTVSQIEYLVFIYAIISLIGEAIRLNSKVSGSILNKIFAPFLRPGEENKPSGLVPYAIAILFVVYLLPPIYAISGMIALVVGDMMGALFGIRFGTIKIFRKKSLQGSLACASSIAIFNYFFLRMIADVDLFDSLILCITGAIFGSLSELFAELIADDNLLIPCATGISMFLSAKVFGIKASL